jgi:hypothetical protein
VRGGGARGGGGSDLGEGESGLRACLWVLDGGGGLAAVRRERGGFFCEQ